MTFLENREPDRVPDVDAGALLARVPPGNAPDLAVLDDGPVRLADVDAEDRAPDPAGADDGARRGDVWTPAESFPRSPPSRPSMSNPSTVTFGALTRTTLPAPRAEEERASPADEADGAVEDEVPLVRPGRHLDRRARRGRVDELLERRRLARGRAPLEGSRRDGRHLLGPRREGEREEERGGERRELSRQAAVFRGLAPPEEEREGEEEHRERRGRRSPPAGRRRPRSSRAACRRRAEA